MGRWLSYDGSVGPVGEHSHPMDCDAAHADEIALLHNADCDAYEARIAELERERDKYRESSAKAYVEAEDLRAELARVKAESLRVVEITPRPFVAHAWYMTPSGLGWWGHDKDGDKCVETPEGYHEHADCKPVRLERWETAE
jgi:hypothetical protein